MRKFSTQNARNDKDVQPTDETFWQTAPLPSQNYDTGKPQDICNKGKAYQTMKTQTIRYGENGGVEIIDIDVSDPQAGEVQVQSAACGICAWDLATYRDGGTAPPGSRRCWLCH